jgi:hypothetical protein
MIRKKKCSSDAKAVGGSRCFLRERGAGGGGGGEQEYIYSRRCLQLLYVVLGVTLAVEWRP